MAFPPGFSASIAPSSMFVALPGAYLPVSESTYVFFPITVVVAIIILCFFSYFFKSTMLPQKQHTLPTRSLCFC
jgi:hypothetical protein